VAEWWYRGRGVRWSFVVVLLVVAAGCFVVSSLGWFDASTSQALLLGGVLLCLLVGVTLVVAVVSRQVRRR
jgi:cytochrome c oxidase subunit IV